MTERGAAAAALHFRLHPVLLEGLSQHATSSSTQQQQQREKQHLEGPGSPEQLNGHQLTTTHNHGPAFGSNCSSSSLGIPLGPGHSLGNSCLPSPPQTSTSREEQQPSPAPVTASGSPSALANSKQKVGGKRSREGSEEEGFWLDTEDYCNGGPYFLSTSGDIDVQKLPGVSVIAWYKQLPERRQLQQGKQEQQGMQLQGNQGQRGEGAGPARGPVSTTSSSSHMEELPPGASSSSSRDVTASGDACGAGQGDAPAAFPAAAAVRCEVGQGVVVLCGTHPELHQAWLDPCGSSNAQWEPERACYDLSSSRQAIGAILAEAGVDGAGSAAEEESLSRSKGGSANDLGCIPGIKDVGVQPNGSSSNKSSIEDSMEVVASQLKVEVCVDKSLALHTRALRARLEGVEATRGLLWATLLSEALL